MRHAKPSDRPVLPPGKVPRGHYHLRLFVVGNGPNSQQALTNLRNLCAKHLKGRCTIETVDVVKDFGAAARDNILITPALVLVAPLPRVMVLGTLSDQLKVLRALRLPEGGRGGGLMSKRKPTYQELEQRLAAAEPVIEALRRHEVDAVVGEEKITYLLLREVGEALLHSDATFRAMFELGGIGMIMAEAPAFCFTRVNQKFCEITGYTAAELRSHTYIGLTYPQDRRHVMAELARVLRGEVDGWSIVKRCLRKDGTVIRVGVHGVALRDANGRVVRIVAMIGALADRPAGPAKRGTQRSVKPRGPPRG